MIYLKLFLEFFYIGLFSFGGGYSTLPFLYHLSETQNWFTSKQLSDMIAVSSITPGPVGINVATFAGFTTSGILGALIATISIILPSFFIVTGIAKLLNKYKNNEYVKSVIHILKPTGCGLLAAVGVNMFAANINLFGIFILIGLFIASITEKRDPLFYLGISGLCGVVANIFNWIG